MVSPAEGIPIVFEVGELADVPGAEQWFTFRLLSDGTANDFVQVLSDDPLLSAETRLVFDLYDQSGRPISLGRATADLRDERAGQYFLRVHDIGNENWRDESLPFQIRIAAATPTRPLVNQLAFYDRDVLDGGSGNNAIIGNGGLDRIYLGSGNNRITAESTEVMGFLSSGNSLMSPPTSDYAAATGYVATNEVVAISDPQLREDLGLRLGKQSSGSALQFTQQELASLTSLDIYYPSPSSLLPIITPRI